MNEVKRIPTGIDRVSGLSGQGGTRDGKPRLERRRKRKKGGDEADGGPETVREAEQRAEEEAPPPEEDDDAESGRHVDVRV